MNQVFSGLESRCPISLGSFSYSYFAYLRAQLAFCSD